MNHFQKEHLKIVRRLAIALHKKSGYDLEDLYSEGCLQYLIKLQKFDETRNAHINTFITVTLWHGLRKYIQEQKKIPFVSFSDLENIEQNASTLFPEQSRIKWDAKEVFSCGKVRMF